MSGWGTRGSRRSFGRRRCPSAGSATTSRGAASSCSASTPCSYPEPSRRARGRRARAGGESPRRLGAARERAALRSVPAGRRVRGLRVRRPDLDGRLPRVPAVAAGIDPGVSDDARVDVVADGGMVRPVVRAPAARAGDRLGLIARAGLGEGAVQVGGAKTTNGPTVASRYPWSRSSVTRPCSCSVRSRAWLSRTPVGTPIDRLAGELRSHGSTRWRIATKTASGSWATSAGWRRPSRSRHFLSRQRGPCRFR